MNFDIKDAFGANITYKQCADYNIYFKWLSDNFDIKFKNSYKNDGVAVKDGFTVPQEDFFKWLDLNICMSMFIQSGNWDVPHILCTDVTDYREHVQTFHMDHVLDILLFAVGRTDEDFEKPYDLAENSNDLVFTFKYQQIIDRFKIIWDEYIDILDNNIPMTGGFYV